MRLALLIFTLIIMLTGNTLAQVQVQGYYRSNGTYVKPHVRSSPDGDRSNNYGPSYGNNMMSASGRDSDRDGIENRYDNDDDNDSILDNNDRSQYSPRF